MEDNNIFDKFNFHDPLSVNDILAVEKLITTKKKIMKSFNEKSVLFLICIVFAMSSCIKPDPGKTQGENALREKISSESRIPMSIQNFTKTNGIKREVQGQPIYTMEFNAEIKIEQKCGTLGDNPFLKDFMPFEQFKNYINNIYYVDSRKTIFYSGALLSYDGEITFEKTDNGWRPAVSNLKNVKIINNPSPMDKFIGEWSGHYVYYDPTSKQNKQGGASYCKIFKDNRGIRYVETDEKGTLGLVFENMKVYLIDNNGVISGTNYDYGHGEYYPFNFTVELKDGTTMIYQKEGDNSGKYEYHKK